MRACAQYLDLWPDPSGESCMAAYNHSTTVSYVERHGAWHHIAVTWTSAGGGRTRLYQDGLLMAEVRAPLTRWPDRESAVIFLVRRCCMADVCQHLIVRPDRWTRHRGAPESDQDQLAWTAWSGLRCAQVVEASP